MEIKELFEKMKTATEEQNDEALAVIQDILWQIKRAYPTSYRKYAQRLDEVYEHSGGYLTEAEALEYVAHMTNKDGSKGEHWTLPQVKEYMAQHSELAGLNPNCFYVALNMMYSDYYKPGRTTETYAMLAKDFLTDKDAPADKLKRYMEAMHS